MREVEREADDALAAFLGEQSSLNGNGFARTSTGKIATADAGVLAFGVLAYDDPVHRLGGRVAERTGHTRQQAHRADVGVLVEALADRQA
jgi:hypothetical protein